MDNEAYWKKRAEERENKWSKKSKETIEKELAEYYEQALSRIGDDIAALYGRYAKDNNLTYAEANKLLTGKEFKQWRMSLEEYLDAADKTGDNKLLLELNTLAMRKRISRLDKLYGDTLKNLHKLGVDVENGMTKFLTGAYKNNYYENLFDIGKTIGIKSSVGEVDDKKIRKVLNASWSGKNYSKRIWKNTDRLAKLIKNEITDGFHRGVSVDKMAKLVQQRMDVGKYEAVRLVRTEMNYVQNQASLDSMKDADMKYYIFIATLDKRTSTPCRAHDRKVYPVKEASPGTNMPPLHPHCRSTIAGSMTGIDTGRGKRTAKDKNGSRIIIPAAMKYDDYYKVYIEKSMTFDEWEKANKKPKAEKNDIIKEKIEYLAKKYEIKFTQIKYPPELLKIPIKELSFDNEHINKERKHTVTRQEAETFISEALCTLIRWNGDFLCYYSKNGATYVNIKEKSIRTAFKKNQYDKNILRFIEEVLMIVEN